MGGEAAVDEGSRREREARGAGQVRSPPATRVSRRTGRRAQRPEAAGRQRPVSVAEGGGEEGRRSQRARECRSTMPPHAL